MLNAGFTYRLGRLKPRTSKSRGHRPRCIIILNCDRPPYICCSNLLYSLASSSSRDGGEFGGGATGIGTLI